MTNITIRILNGRNGKLLQVRINQNGTESIFTDDVDVDALDWLKIDLENGIDACNAAIESIEG